MSTKTNRDLCTRVFPSFASASCNYFEFWLVKVLGVSFQLCDWLGWKLWLKTALWNIITTKSPYLILTWQIWGITGLRHVTFAQRLPERKPLLSTSAGGSWHGLLCFRLVYQARYCYDCQIFHLDIWLFYCRLVRHFLLQAVCCLLRPCLHLTPFLKSKQFCQWGHLAEWRWEGLYTPRL